jgi:hypothetical protein
LDDVRVADIESFQEEADAQGIAKRSAGMSLRGKQ